MSKQRAIDLVRKTFESPFDKKNYIAFIKDLLNHIEEAQFIYQGNYIPKQFQSCISHYERVGKYSDGENRIDILIVYLKKERSIENARSMQRNFIAGYLQGKYGSDRDKDAALVAFVSPNQDDWRFSLVRMEYTLEETTKGGMKARADFSPARRWSFLVGRHERSHTAQNRLVPIIANDEHNPTLAELEEAFNIEKVTKEFFEKYRGLFIWTKDELDKAVQANPITQIEFEDKKLNTVDLAKKLLGQIIFLYYLQKKGWFGVPKDGRWGEGSKNFLRELFEKKHGDYSNFFNDILEPLFYEALRMDRSHDEDYYSRFNSKIPFLNGGLFDPMNNYDWVKTDILLSNELFSNRNKTKEGDIGNGILDIFDRYNFTVKEDEPFEKEVAIDPELLGKAYEKFNAIRPDNYVEYLKALKSGKKGEETKFNKQYGVYYTSREIVHYMCQQSLVQYLHTELDPEIAYQKIGDNKLDMFGNAVKVGQLDILIKHRSIDEITKDEIAFFIQHGEGLQENEATVEANGRETEIYSYRIPESIRKNAALIDAKLAAIRVCDPAVGSGAFPVGMMTEIVRARQVLQTWTKTGQTPYDLKRECIENSLYGVDIDAGAVEIAKLRLWLSLVVDEDDPQNIKPLPNLDYKIVCGDLLVGVEKNLFNQELFSELEKVKLFYFNATAPVIKQQYKKQIDNLIDRITNGRSRFDFEVYFSEVFHEKNGFDVVIGNPPYLESRHPDFNDKLKKLYQISTKKRWKEDSKYITRGSDLLIYFIETSIFYVNRSGCVILITQNSWLDTEYGNKFQAFLLKNTQVRLVIDSDYRYFASGDGPNINAVITLFVGKTPDPLNIVTFARYHENNELVK